MALKSWREQAGLEGGEENVSNDVFGEATANVGAEIMGRRQDAGHESKAEQQALTVYNTACECSDNTARKVNVT